MKQRFPCKVWDTVMTISDFLGSRKKTLIWAEQLQIARRYAMEQRFELSFLRHSLIPKLGLVFITQTNCQTSIIQPISGKSHNWTMPGVVAQVLPQRWLRFGPPSWPLGRLNLSIFL